MNKKFNIKSIAMYAVLISLTTLATMIITIPIPATKGFINIGDVLVMVSALLVGAKGGMVIGGIGSAMADVLLGYTHYAPITLVVKGIEGFLVGKIFEKSKKKSPRVATIVSGLWMATGYLIAEIFIYGKAAFVSLPGNIVQGLASAMLAIIVFPMIERVYKLNNQ